MTPAVLHLIAKQNRRYQISDIACAYSISLAAALITILAGCGLGALAADALMNEQLLLSLGLRP